MNLNKSTEVYLYLLENGYDPEFDETCPAVIYFNKRDSYREYAIQLNFVLGNLRYIHYTEAQQESAYRQWSYCREPKNKEDFVWQQHLSVIASQDVEDFLIDLVLRFL